MVSLPGYLTQKMVDLLLFRADASRRCQSHGRPSGKGRRRRADHSPPPPSLAHRSSMVRNFAGARRCRSTTIEAHTDGALLSKLTMSEHVVDVHGPEHYSRGDGDGVMRALNVIEHLKRISVRQSTRTTGCITFRKPAASLFRLLLVG